MFKLSILYYKLSFIANFMKRKPRGSILIWSIFLVIYISFSFLYISNRISYNLDKNKQKILQMQGDNIGDNFTFDTQNINLLNNEIWEIKYFRNFVSTLREKQTLNFTFTQANTGSINIQNGGPLFYKVFSGATIYTSWFLLDGVFDISLASSSKLSLENLWWLSKINLDFDSNTGVMYPYNYFTIKKNIWGSDLIKKIVEIH